MYIEDNAYDNVSLAVNGLFMRQLILNNDHGNVNRFLVVIQKKTNTPLLVNPTSTERYTKQHKFVLFVINEDYSFDI